MNKKVLKNLLYKVYVVICFLIIFLSLLVAAGKGMTVDIVYLWIQVAFSCVSLFKPIKEDVEGVAWTVLAVVYLIYRREAVLFLLGHLF